MTVVKCAAFLLDRLAVVYNIFKLNVQRCLPFEYDGLGYTVIIIIQYYMIFILLY